jgi:hypothetical protein
VRTQKSSIFVSSAPEDFYKHSVKGNAEKYDLRWLETALNVGLQELLKKHDGSLNSKLKMSFAFEEISQNFISRLPDHDHGFVMKFDPRPVQWKESASHAVSIV